MAVTRGLGKAGASILRSVLERFNKALRPGLKQIGPAPPRAAITTGAKKTAKGKELMKPGPYASESIPARGSKRDFTAEERRQIDRIGARSGCHSCGTKTPGTKSGHFVIDHQPPTPPMPKATTRPHTKYGSPSPTKAAMPNTASADSTPTVRASHKATAPPATGGKNPCVISNNPVYY